MQQKKTIEQLIEEGGLTQWDSNYIFSKANDGHSILFVGDKQSAKIEYLNAFIEAVPPDTNAFGFQNGNGLYRDAIGNLSFHSLSRPATLVMADYEEFKKEEDAALIIIDEVRGATEANIVADAAITGLSVWSTVTCYNPGEALGRIAELGCERLGDDRFTAKNRLLECQFVIVSIKGSKVMGIEVTA